MTSALIAFYENESYKMSVYYNSDGYPKHVGKIVSGYLSKEINCGNIAMLFDGTPMEYAAWLQNIEY